MTAHELFNFLVEAKWDDLSPADHELLSRVIWAWEAERDARKNALDRFERLDIPLNKRHCDRCADARAEREEAEAEMIRCLGHLWGKK